MGYISFTFMVDYGVDIPQIGSLDTSEWFDCCWIFPPLHQTPCYIILLLWVSSIKNISSQFYQLCNVTAKYKGVAVLTSSKRVEHSLPNKAMGSEKERFHSPPISMRKHSCIV